MDLSGFDTREARSVRLVSHTFAGTGQTALLQACVLEVMYEDREEEVAIDFGDNPPSYSAVEAFVRVLNRQLGAE